MYCPTNELDQKYINNNINKIKADKSKSINGTVCYYWVKGTCKNGDSCNYLHENIPERYPDCPHGINCTKQGQGCPFKHIKKERKECPSYNSGYCSFGKQCKDLHNQKEICINYLLGFCPDGPNCQLYHFKTMITPGQDDLDYLSKSLPNLDNWINRYKILSLWSVIIYKYSLFYKIIY